MRNFGANKFVSVKQYVSLKNGIGCLALALPAAPKLTPSKVSFCCCLHSLQAALLVMCTGHLVYHGPREHVMEFFEGLGFACPERKGVADFLQEVTSRKDQKVHTAGWAF